MSASRWVRTAALVACSVVSSVVSAQQVRVVTTLPVLADLARAIGGEHVSVEFLARASQDPHFVRPRPTLMTAARSADLFVEIGLGLEIWAQQIVDGTGNARIQRGQPGRVVAIEGVSLLEVDPEASRADGHVHVEGNPHVWLDPVRVRVLSSNIAEGLQRIAPAHAEDFATNLAALRRRIDVAMFGAAAVDAFGGDALVAALGDGDTDFDALAKLLAGSGDVEAVELGGWLAKAVALRGTKLVTRHKLWSYFAQRFGIEVVATIEKYPGVPPSAKHRDEVVEVIGKQGVFAVVSAAFYDPKPARYVADRAAVPLLQLPVDVDPDGASPDYFALIDLLLDRLLAAHDT